MIKTLIRKIISYFKEEKREDIFLMIKNKIEKAWYTDLEIYRNLSNKSKCKYRNKDIIFYYWWLEFVRYFDFDKLRIVLDNLYYKWLLQFITAVDIKERINFYTTFDKSFSIDYTLFNKMYKSVEEQITNYLTEVYLAKQENIEMVNWIINTEATIENNNQCKEQTLLEKRKCNKWKKK